MREIDFLPHWYSQIQRQYRRLIMQLWVSLMILVVTGTYAIAKRNQLQNARLTTTRCLAQISRSKQAATQLDKKVKLEKELSRPNQIVARIGIGVESTRLLRSLEEALTPYMSLTNVSLETIEKQAIEQPRASVIAANPSVRSASDEAELDRQLHVVVDGIAPADTQCATFLSRLLKVACFENVSLDYMRPGQSREGHVTREFQVAFDLDLNSPAEVKP